MPILNKYKICQQVCRIIRSDNLYYVKMSYQSYISYIIKFIDMNKTIISIEVQDEGDKEAIIIVRGERNNQILFEEKFAYSDSEKHSLRLHLLKERFLRIYPQIGRSIGVLCIRKLLNDITKRSKMDGCPDYRVFDK
jgi:hypothetical protein